MESLMAINVRGTQLCRFSWGKKTNPNKITCSTLSHGTRMGHMVISDSWCKNTTQLNCEHSFLRCWYTFGGDRPTLVVISAKVTDQGRSSTEVINNCVEALWKDLYRWVFCLLWNLAYYSLCFSLLPFSSNIRNVPVLWEFAFLFLTDTHTQFEVQVAQKVILGSI